MKVAALRIVFLATALAGSALYSASRGTDVDQAFAKGHLTGVTAQLTLRDGTVQPVKLEGVGCPQGICSRTAIHGKAGAEPDVRAWLDSLAAIRDITATEALFVGKDGTTRRMSLLYDFRVLYLANYLGGPDKIDLSKLRSVEFASR
jgi:hypothetical protein